MANKKTLLAVFLAILLIFSIYGLRLDGDAPQLSSSIDHSPISQLPFRVRIVGWVAFMGLICCSFFELYAESREGSS